MMGAEPGRPNEPSPDHRIDTARVLRERLGYDKYEDATLNSA
jgi:hypothetical protein